MFGFGEAIALLKAGKRVTREGWDAKEFLMLVPGSPSKDNRPSFLGVIDKETAHGHVVPWLASQKDILSEDWKEC